VFAKGYLSISTRHGGHCTNLSKLLFPANAGNWNSYASTSISQGVCKASLTMLSRKYL